MDAVDLERIGLNRNEAKVYLALIIRGQATASELVKAIGVHRNIVYDNLEKLIEKGLVSFIVDGAKRKFIAQDPAAIIDYLQSKKLQIDRDIALAAKMAPSINKLLSSSDAQQDATIFRGVKGVKKVLSDTLQSREIWCIGTTNESIAALGDTFWKNYNQKIKAGKVKERILLNNDYEDKDTGVLKVGCIKTRALPKQLNQVTETILYSGKVALFVYSSTPLVIVMENKEIFRMYRAHFDFLWGVSK